MSNDDSVDELLEAAYAVDGPEGNRTLYARWADTYESGFVADSKYVYHEQVAALFAVHRPDHLSTTDVIADIGCGTGLAGLAVRRHVAVRIVGIDISPEMLRQAAAKQHDGSAVYHDLIEADLTRPLAIDTDTYAGAISVGTFTHGHVGASALAEVVRIVRPGGTAAIGINAAHFASVDFGPALEELLAVGQIEQLRLVDVPIYADTARHTPDATGRVALFAVA